MRETLLIFIPILAIISPVELPQMSAVNAEQEHATLFPAWFGEKCGYIDKSNKLVINPQFDWSKEFSEGRAAVRVGGKWGYIDKTGKLVIAPQFDYASGFSEGLARVTNRLIGKCGYIDTSGNWGFFPQYGTGDFSKGLAPVWINRRPDAWGYIDKSGKLVWPPSEE